jgi:hypothetical protein
MSFPAPGCFSIYRAGAVIASLRAALAAAHIAPFQIELEFLEITLPTFLSRSDLNRQLQREMFREVHCIDKTIAVLP